MKLAILISVILLAFISEVNLRKLKTKRRGSVAESAAKLPDGTTFVFWAGFHKAGEAVSETYAHGLNPKGIAIDELVTNTGMLAQEPHDEWKEGSQKYIWWDQRSIEFANEAKKS